MLVADIAGGSFPAVINILLALRARDRSGQGCHLDIAMTDAMFTFAWYALALGAATGKFPKPGELCAGRRLAALPALSGQGRQDRRLRGDRAEILGRVLPGDRVAGGIGRRLARSESNARSSCQVDRGAHVRGMAADLRRCRLLHDDCGAAGAGVAAIRISSQRGLFGHTIESAAGKTMPALPLPIAPEFRDSAGRQESAAARQKLKRLAAHQPRLAAAGATPSRMTARRSGPMRSII